MSTYCINDASPKCLLLLVNVFYDLKVMKIPMDDPFVSMILDIQVAFQRLLALASSCHGSF